MGGTSKVMIVLEAHGEKIITWEGYISNSEELNWILSDLSMDYDIVFTQRQLTDFLSECPGLELTDIDEFIFDGSVVFAEVLSTGYVSHIGGSVKPRDTYEQSELSF
jgi:hypothetical protein